MGDCGTGRGWKERRDIEQEHGTQVGPSLLVLFYPFLFLLSLMREILADHLPTPQTRGFPQTVQQEERMEERRCTGEKSRFPK